MRACRPPHLASRGWRVGWISWGGASRAWTAVSTPSYRGSRRRSAALSPTSTSGSPPLLRCARPPMERRAHPRCRRGRRRQRWGRRRVTRSSRKWKIESGSRNAPKPPSHCFAPRPAPRSIRRVRGWQGHLVAGKVDAEAGRTGRMSLCGRLRLAVGIRTAPHKRLRLLLPSGNLQVAVARKQWRYAGGNSGCVHRRRSGMRPVTSRPTGPVSSGPTGLSQQF